MYKDLFGKKRIKIGLHHHTTCSDGRLTPEQTVDLYRSAGYDAIAFTDHWFCSSYREIDGFPTLPGCEYNTGTYDTHAEVWHITCLCADKAPQISRDATPQQIIDGIHEAGGLAVLAHPAWSLNTPQMIKSLHGFDAIEIYNTVSGKGLSRRPDSSLIVDMLASDGIILPLLAADDSHYYEPSGIRKDACNAFIMAECDSPDPISVCEAIKENRFYASTGPEVHLRVENGVAVVDCSPVYDIAFMSNFSISAGRTFVGDGLTHAEYTPHPDETFIRAVVTDVNGRQAWTNCIKLRDVTASQ